MKILLICASYPPEFQGGTEVVVKAEARSLLAAGYSVQVVTGSNEVYEAGVVCEECVDGVQVLRLSRTAEEALAADWIHPRLTDLVLREARDCDLVHLHHWSSISGDLVRRLSPLVPVVVSRHDHFASCPRFFRTPSPGITCPPPGSVDNCADCVADAVPELSRGALVNLLEERTTSYRAELAAAAEVIAPSEHVRDCLARELGISSATWRVVPHGLCREFASQTREGSRAGPLSVLHFGNRSRIKGSLDLVRALSHESGIKLVLAGREVEPGFDDLLRQEAGSLDLEIHGSYGASDLRRLARSADLAAFPSQAFESYGLVVEEALALGLPVWVSDRGALPEVLARAARFGCLPGGVLPAENPRAWRDALRELVKDPDKLQDAIARVPPSVRTAAQATGDLLDIFRPLTTRSNTPSP